jgi:DNA modification methylase
VGGKPLWLMSRLVEDYSRPGDLICDPVAGGFATGKAAVSVGRKFIGGDVLEEHAQLGAAWAKTAKQRGLFSV